MAKKKSEAKAAEATTDKEPVAPDTAPAVAAAEATGTTSTATGDQSAAGAEATATGPTTAETGATTTATAATASAPTAAENTTAAPKVEEKSDTEKLKEANERLSLINQARMDLRDCQLDVADKEQRKREADADLKAAIGRRDAAVIELERVIDEDKIGQMRLPFPAPAKPAKPVVVDPGDTAPISVLNTSSILALVGQDVWEHAKDVEQPIGMTPSHMEKLEAADLRTVASLEKLMRDDRYWSKTVKLGEKGEARLIETLRVWRSKNPQPEVDDATSQRSKTVLQKLAEQNAAPATQAEAQPPAVTDEVRPLPGLEDVTPEATSEAPPEAAATGEPAAADAGQPEAA